DYGLIDVGFVAGFDANDVDGDGNTGTGAEAGEFGTISATSTYGNIVLGIGARAAGSVTGDVFAVTGDQITTLAQATDTLVSGNVTISALSGMGSNQTGL